MLSVLLEYVLIDWLRETLSFTRDRSFTLLANMSLYQISDRFTADTVLYFNIHIYIYSDGAIGTGGINIVVRQIHILSMHIIK